MTARALICALLCVAAPVPADARDRNAEASLLFEAQFPGKIVGYALPASPGGSRSIVALVGPAETTPDDEEKKEEDRLPPCPRGSDGAGGMSLHRFDPVAATLTEIAAGLPGDCTGVDAVDLDGDGREELIVARDGSLSRLVDGKLAPIVEDPGLVWSGIHPTVVETPELYAARRIATTTLGRLRLFGPGDAGTGWRRLAGAEIPIEGGTAPDGLRIGHALPRFVGARADGTLIFATDAEQSGTRRVRTWLIGFPPAGEPQVTECWAALPAPEHVLTRHVLMLDDRPVLLLTTMPAGKLSMLGEKLLRVYPLRRDRSRLGVAPVFAAASRMNLWQKENVRLLDVNGDGREDLVLGYWKGLKDSKVVLDAYLRAADGTLRDSPRTTAFNVDEGDRTFLRYGGDLDGDGLADLLLRTRNDLLVYRGRASGNGGKLVEPSAVRIPIGETPDAEGSVTVSVSAGGGGSSTAEPPGGHPRRADLDGDGRDEILLVSVGPPSTLRVIRLVPEKP